MNKTNKRNQKLLVLSVLNYAEKLTIFFPIERRYPPTTNHVALGYFKKNKFKYRLNKAVLRFHAVWGNRLSTDYRQQYVNIC